MLVVSDATPLNILVRLNFARILEQLFTTVLVPHAVWSELTHPDAPPALRSWCSSPPSWIMLAEPKFMLPLGVSGKGEVAAILLAVERQADMLLMDDRKARREAARIGLAVTGTLGILELAASHRLIDLDAALDRLEGLDFHVDPALIAELRDRSRRIASSASE